MDRAPGLVPFLEDRHDGQVNADRLFGSCVRGEGEERDRLASASRSPALLPAEEIGVPPSSRNAGTRSARRPSPVQPPRPVRGLRPAALHDEPRQLTFGRRRLVPR